MYSAVGLHKNPYIVSNFDNSRKIQTTLTYFIATAPNTLITSKRKPERA